jgi:hypothetical protein
MGSHLSGLKAEIFLQNSEKQFLKHTIGNKRALYYARYLDFMCKEITGKETTLFLLILGTIIFWFWMSLSLFLVVIVIRAFQEAFTRLLPLPTARNPLMWMTVEFTSVSVHLMDDQGQTNVWARVSQLKCARV